MPTAPPNATKYRNCIICRKDKPTGEFNEEHVFVATIGGGLTIQSVCKTCNTFLSETFNQPFLDDTRIGLARKLLNLNRAGTNRSIANPLKRVNVGGEDGEKFYVTFKSGQPTLNRKPEHAIIQGVEGFNVTIHADPEFLKTRMDAILKAYGYNESEIKNVSQTIETVSRPISFDTTDKAIMCEGLKVAYEFTASILPDYLSDEWSKEYARFLETGKMNEFIIKRIYEGESVLKVCDEDYQRILSAPTYLHAIFVKSYKDFGLVCIVKFFNYIVFYRMSEKCLLDMDKEVLLFNDPLSTDCIAYAP
jgi:hypothetical protein